jgi:hypothetical protein
LEKAANDSILLKKEVDKGLENLFRFEVFVISVLAKVLFD